MSKKHLLLAPLVIGALAAAGQLLAEPAAAAKQEVTSNAPAELTFEHAGTTYKLAPTGTSTRTKFFVKVYKITSYLQDPVKGKAEFVFEELLDPRKAKALEQAWLHDADLPKIRDTYSESFKKVLTDQEFSALQSQINQFLGFYREDVKAGDHHSLRWYPDGTIELFINEKSQGTIQNEAFAKALWSIWVGPKSVVSRSQLIEKIVEK